MIDIKEIFPILHTFTKPNDRICLTQQELKEGLTKIITEVLKEAADSAEPSYYTNYGEINEDQIEPFVYKKSITSVINKVKF